MDRDNRRHEVYCDSNEFQTILWSINYALAERKWALLFWNTNRTSDTNTSWLFKMITYKNSILMLFSKMRVLNASLGMCHPLYNFCFSLIKNNFFKKFCRLLHVIDKIQEMTRRQVNGDFGWGNHTSWNSIYIFRGRSNNTHRCTLASRWTGWSGLTLNIWKSISSEHVTMIRLIFASLLSYKIQRSIFW